MFKSKKIYDVCLISDTAINFNKTYKIKEIESGFALLVKFVIKFCKDHKKKIIFPAKEQEKKMMEEFKALDFFPEKTKNIAA